MDALRGVVIGAGYFSRYHYDAWSRIDGVEIAACCDLEEERARTVAAEHGIARTYADPLAMLDRERPDFADIATPPSTHRQLVAEASRRGIHIVCQKPLAPALREARAMVETARLHGVRFVVHENFRFQPWFREVKRLLDEEAIGERLHTVGFSSRMGDGWGADAYLERQPYFRDMPRLLVYETGIHYIDTFRYLGGEIERVSAFLRRLNPAIRGEDRAVVVFELASGAIGLYDANRYNESLAAEPRYTFGELLVEGDGGSIRLAGDGSLSIHRLGAAPQPHPYRHERRGFAGDCCHAALAHFADCLREGRPFETEAAGYLRNLAVQEAVYRSAEAGRSVAIDEIAGVELSGTDGVTEEEPE